MSQFSRALSKGAFTEETFPYTRPTFKTFSYCQRRLENVFGCVLVQPTHAITTMRASVESMQISINSRAHKMSRKIGRTGNKTCILSKILHAGNVQYAA